MSAHRGLVLGVYNQFADVLVEGEQREATIAGRLRHARPVVGDDVELRELDDGSVRIESVGERRGTLIRGAFRGREQLVAANVDLLVIVAAASDPPLRAGLIDRYLVAAWRGGIEAALALTKLDLPADEREVGRIESLLESLGHRVLRVNPRTGDGVERVRQLIGTRTAVLAGHSGVGKTTLSNALTLRDDATSLVNPVVGKGRHTTTQARYLPLAGGGALIDTAGIRGYGITGIPLPDLEKAFPEIAAAAADCRFDGCLHEPEDEGCAVPARTSPQRLESYRKLLGELRDPGR